MLMHNIPVPGQFWMKFCWTFLRNVNVVQFHSCHFDRNIVNCNISNLPINIDRCLQSHWLEFSIINQISRLCPCHNSNYRYRYHHAVASTAMQFFSHWTAMVHWMDLNAAYISVLNVGQVSRSLIIQFDRWWFCRRRLSKCALPPFFVSFFPPVWKPWQQDGVKNR